MYRFSLCCIAGMMTLAEGLPFDSAKTVMRDRPTRLSDDKRLDKKITLTERYASLADVLQKVSQMTGIKIRAATPIAEENLIVLVSERPAGETLDLLADNLGYHWSVFKYGKTEEGYELWQDLASRQREQKLRNLYRRLALAELEQELAIQWRYADLPKWEESRRYQRLLQELKTPGLSLEKIEELTQERQRLSNALYNGRTRPLLTLFLQLSDTQRDRLMKNRVIRFSSVGHPSMERLPSEITRALLVSRPDDAAKWYEQHPPVDVRADMRLKQTPGKVTLLLRSQIVGHPPPGWSGKADMPVRISRPLTMAKVDKDLVTGPTDFSDPRLNKTIAIALKSKRPLVEDPSTYVDYLTTSDIVASIAEQQPALAFIGDAYLKPVGYPLQTRGTVGDLLNRMASTASTHWKFDRRGYVLLRSSTVFADRPRSIPAPLLRVVMNQSLKNDGLSLRDHANLAARLTDEQVEGLRDENEKPLTFRWPRITTQTLVTNPDDLRLLAALSSTQFDRLLREEILSYASLSIRQRAAYERALDTDTLQYEDDPIEIAPQEVLIRSVLRLIMKKPASEQEKANGTHADISYSVANTKTAVITRTLWIAQGDPAYKPKITTATDRVFDRE